MRKFILFLFILGLFSCQSASENYSGKEAMMDQSSSEAIEEYEEQPPTQRSPNEPIAPAQRKIIKTADYRIQVENVDESTANAKEIVEANGGYITSMNQSNSTYEINNDISIRVPGESFEKLLDALGKDAIFVNHKRINSKDVTEEFVDIQTRLKTKKDVRDKYIELLRNKAKTVEDVLKAEEAIRVLQEEIESKEGRLKYLKSQVSLSTINLSIYQRVEHKNAPATYTITFFDKVKSGFKNGWSLLTGLIIALINIWPFLILFGVLYWKRGSIFGRFRRKE